MSEQRRAELAENLAEVRERIACAARAAGRLPAEITLVAVTKARPATDALLLAELGVADLGESRDQEARRKRSEVRDGRPIGAQPLSWHLIGRLQSNKAASVATWADVVQSVDRTELVAPLSFAADRAGRTLGVCVQVSLDADPQRGGVDPSGVSGLAAAVQAAGALSLRGLMAVAPLGQEPAAAFERLAAVQADLLREHPEAVMLSAGMSGDLEQAVAAGATHLRIGTALLGARPPIVR